ncbi:hypothetical protein BSKO_11021 [Bryopsis sp. KO-2023]|nr:hypothetical protein BSKO_11021 [Bryopsis sp. KO-2023]
MTFQDQQGIKQQALISMQDCGDCSVATTTDDRTSGGERSPSLLQAGDDPTQRRQRQPTNESAQNSPQPRLCRAFGRKISKIVIPEKFAMVGPAPSPRAAASSSGGLNKTPFSRQPSAKLRALVGLFERLGDSPEFASKRREPWNPPNWGGIRGIITDIENRLEAASEGSKAIEGNPPGPLTRTWDPKQFMATRELLCLELQRLRHEAGEGESLKPSWVRREVGFWMAESGELDAGRLRPGVRSWVVDWIQRAGVQDAVEALNDSQWGDRCSDLEWPSKGPSSVGHSRCGSFSGRSRRSSSGHSRVGSFGQGSFMGDPPLTPTTVSEGYHPNPAYSSSMDWDEPLGSPYPLPLDGLSRGNPFFNPHSSLRRTSTPVEDIQELCKGSVGRRLMRDGVEVAPAIARGRSWRRRRGGGMSMSSSEGMDPPLSECGSWLAPSEDCGGGRQYDGEKQGPVLSPSAISSLMKRRGCRGDFTCKYPRQSASGGEEFWSASSEFPSRESSEEEMFWTSPSELDLAEMQEFRMSDEQEFPAGIPEDAPMCPEDVEVSVISLFDITEDLLDSLGTSEEEFRPSAFTPVRRYTSRPSSNDFDQEEEEEEGTIDEFFSVIHSSKSFDESSVEDFYSCCDETLVKNATLLPPQPIRRWSSLEHVVDDVGECEGKICKEVGGGGVGGDEMIEGGGGEGCFSEYVSPFNVDKFEESKVEPDEVAIKKSIFFGGWNGGGGLGKGGNEKGKGMVEWGAHIDAFRPDWDSSEEAEKPEGVKFRERDLDNDIWQLGRLDNEQRNDVRRLGLRFSSDRYFSDGEGIFRSSPMMEDWQKKREGETKKRASWQRRGLFTDSDVEIAGYVNCMEPFGWRDVPSKEKGSINDRKFGGNLCNDVEGEYPYEQVIQTNVSAQGCDSMRVLDELL